MIPFPVASRACIASDAGLYIRVSSARYWLECSKKKEGIVSRVYSSSWRLQEHFVGLGDLASSRWPFIGRFGGIHVA